MICKSVGFSNRIKKVKFRLENTSKKSKSKNRKIE